MTAYTVRKTSDGRVTMLAAPPAAFGVIVPHTPVFYPGLPTPQGHAALIDGPMFDTGSPTLRVQYRLKQDGRVLAAGDPETRTHGHTLALGAGKPQWIAGATDVGTTSAQLFPDLVTDGRVVQVDGPQSRPVGRAGAGLLPDGTVFLAFGHDVTLQGFAQGLLALGAKQAGYTDGGGSTQGYLGDYVYPVTEHRAVPSFLVLAPGVAPSRRSGGGAVLVGLGVAATAWWLATRKGGRR